MQQSRPGVVDNTVQTVTSLSEHAFRTHSSYTQNTMSTPGIFLRQRDWWGHQANSTRSWGSGDSRCGRWGQPPAPI